MKNIKIVFKCKAKDLINKISATAVTVTQK